MTGYLWGPWQWAWVCRWPAHQSSGPHGTQHRCWSRPAPQTGRHPKGGNTHTPPRTHTGEHGPNNVSNNHTQPLPCWSTISLQCSLRYDYEPLYRLWMPNTKLIMAISGRLCVCMWMLSYTCLSWTLRTTVSQNHPHLQIPPMCAYKVGIVSQLEGNEFFTKATHGGGVSNLD